MSRSVFEIIDVLMLVLSCTLYCDSGQKRAMFFYLFISSKGDQPLPELPQEISDLTDNQKEWLLSNLAMETFVLLRLGQIVVKRVTDSFEYFRKFGQNPEDYCTGQFRNGLRSVMRDMRIPSEDAKALLAGLDDFKARGILRLMTDHIKLTFLSKKKKKQKI